MTYHLQDRGRVRDPLGADTAPAGSDEVRALQQQINRYIPRVLPDILTHPVPITGVMDTQTALYAARILFERAKRALDTYGPSEPASGFYHKAYEAALAHLTAPMPWIGQNLKQVTDDVAHFADFLGLPGAAGGTFGQLVSDWRVWVAAAGVGIVVMARRRKRR